MQANISPSAFRWTIAIAVSITLLVLFFRMDWSGGATPPVTPNDPIPPPYNPPVTVNPPSNPVPPPSAPAASRWPLWDRKTIVPGPSPWKEVCSFKDVSAVGQNFAMCIRAYDDIVSSNIRQSGRWGDCDILINLWNRESASSPAAKNADAEGIFVDAGANIGSCSLLMATFGKRTYGFEPSRANFFYLSSSAMANTPQIREKLNLYQMGLGEAATKAPVFVAKGNAGNAQIHSTSDPAIGDWQNQQFDTEDSITVGPMDDVLWPDANSPPPHIRVMKMDVQGYEVKILKGASRLLQAGAVGILKTELTPHFLAGQGTSSKELLQIMKSHNYLYFDGNSGQEINPDGNYPGEVMFIRKQ